MRTTVFFLLSALFFLLPKETHASLVIIKSNGEAIVNVLASQDGEVEHSGEEGILDISDLFLSLSKEDGRSYLTLDLPNDQRKLDITDYKDDIIEIEGATDPQKLTIGKEGDKFSISQDGLTVVTDYAIEVDADDHNLLVTTPTGKKFLLVFPQEAALSLLRSNLVNKIAKEDSITMSESDGDLAYEIHGTKFIQLFTLFGFDVEVATRVSATNGQVLAITSPAWMRVFSAVLI